MKIFNKKFFAFLFGAMILLNISVIPAMAQDDFTVPLKQGNHVQWIDRLDLSGAVDDNGQNYAEALYKTLVDAIDPKSEIPYLIDPTSAPHYIDDDDPSIDYHYITVASFSGRRKEIKAKVKKAFVYVQTIVEALTRDHPSVFWISDRSHLLSYFNVETGLQEVHFVLCEMNSCYGEEPFDIRQKDYRSISTLAAAIAERDQCVEKITAPIINKNRYEQVKYLNHWLTHHNCCYSGDLESIDSDTTPGPFRCLSALKGSTGLDGPVCEGYSTAFKVLCDRLEIPCVLVEGPSHMWNYVQMEDDNWYAVDVSYNNPMVKGCSAPISGYENEECLLVGSQTKINNSLFINSHPVTNMVSDEPNTTAFMNGPQLSSYRYWPNQ